MYLSFISDEDLLKAVKSVCDVIEKRRMNINIKLNENVIDPFSALFDASTQQISIAERLQQEKARQVQKTLQNVIGEFHQNIIWSMEWWVNLWTGWILDVQNKKMKIVAEIKNKFNTTKGSDKMKNYRDIEIFLWRDEYVGYTGYYVEIIPKNKNTYDKPFTPSNNQEKIRMAHNEMIRSIDGKSFYDMASGEKRTLYRLFKVIPTILSELWYKTQDLNAFDDIFHLAYDEE